MPQSETKRNMQSFQSNDKRQDRASNMIILKMK
uniref:Uncharacterized protein n=1 Tax=Anguilla anguilla TaxID=7936 RepID=A0A0E9TWT2_ANGAN